MLSHVVQTVSHAGCHRARRRGRATSTLQRPARTAAALAGASG